MSKTLSVNELAWKLLVKMLENSDLYGVKVRKSELGTVIVDAGLEAKGGFQAGEIITQICMGGCGKAKIICKKYGKLEFPSIFVYTDHPVIATLGSQYAGWQIKEEEYFAIGSGPARALALKPKKIYDEIGYKDNFNKAIVVLETDKPPSSKLIKRIASDCKIDPKNLAIILTPTTSIAGAVQVSGRIIETGIHKLRRIGLNPNVILHAWGIAPIPPSHPKFPNAMARTNDAILYGGSASYVVEHDDDELKKIVKKAPSTASEAYGKPFIEIFKEAKYDFYKVDPDLFAPAIVSIYNKKTGRVFSAGRINTDILETSLGVKH